MIIVMGHMKFAIGEGAKVAPLLAAHAEAVMQEEGCETYSFAFDAGDPDLVRIAERWTSADALAAHGAAPHQREFGRALRAFTMENIRVDAWNGEFWRTLIGG
ncbi:putative quinol monooxygenase [Sphingomonas sp.]|jgi:quinol monooxygenase YgiN|uniref:putative quinol monooxygenase n=1 Tax=Sphingomonas sp. TaxID=28214 RepID=UPI002D7E5D6B|nr:antibiotic biosynthesis monooxygenase [Sphingomonas sp.]HEU0043714.1 antibiotic biosynthesis monooxygenase [Sphingomonas sp.]